MDYGESINVFATGLLCVFPVPGYRSRNNSTPRTAAMRRTLSYSRARCPLVSKVGERFMHLFNHI